MSARRRNALRILSIYAVVFAVSACFSTNTSTQPLIAHALLFGMVIVGAVVMIRNTRRTVRTDEVRCVHCGYDLRATPQRCPECGASAARFVIV